MRTFPDGTMYLPKRDPAKEAEMDRLYDRIPGELKWVLKSEDQGLEQFRGTHKGMFCYIVGKGPSLDLLEAKHFESGWPVFAMNEAIHKIEKLNLNNPSYCVQQDWNLRQACIPKKSVHFVSRSAFIASKNLTARAYNPKILGATGNSLSAEIAMRIAHRMGIVGALMYGFDACINKNTTYAKEIGYPSSKGGDPNRFLGHRKIIDRVSKELDFPVELLIPKV